MERIKGLNEYVKNEKYRKALNLPNEQEEEYTMLAQGEYNINYSFTHPKTGKKLLLRVNCGSQMHLENQIEYEYHALELLADSGRKIRSGMNVMPCNCWKHREERQKCFM
mgnify:CR=1 FL=1